MDVPQRVQRESVVSENVTMVHTHLHTPGLAAIFHVVVVVVVVVMMSPVRQCLQ